jgi:hypothetical protein
MTYCTTFSPNAPPPPALLSTYCFVAAYKALVGSAFNIKLPVIVPPVNDNLESSYVYKLVTSPIT